MSSEGLIPFVKIEQGDAFPVTEIIGESAHDLPTLIKSMKDLRERINSHLTDLCNSRASMKADSRDLSNAVDSGQEGKKTKQGKNSAKKMKKLDQVKDECD